MLSIAQHLYMCLTHIHTHLILFDILSLKLHSFIYSHKYNIFLLEMI